MASGLQAPVRRRQKIRRSGYSSRKKTPSRRASQPPFWRIFQLDRTVGPPSPCSSSTFAHQAETVNAPAIAGVGTTPVGPLSPLFLDIRPTSIKKTPNPWDGPPPSSGSWSLNGPTILDCQVVVYRFRDHFSMATPSPQQCLVLQPLLRPPSASKSYLHRVIGATSSDIRRNAALFHI